MALHKSITTQLGSVLTTLLLLFYPLALGAQERDTTMLGDKSITYTYTPLAEPETPVERYLSSNLGNRSVKLNLIGAPSYSASRGWSLTAEANLYYRGEPNTTATPDALTLSATASLKGYYNITLCGHNTLHRHHLSYGGAMLNEPTRCYGIDRESASKGEYGNYTARNYNAWLHYRYNLRHGLFATLTAAYRSRAARNMTPRTEELTAGHSLHASALDIALGIGIDTRRYADFRTHGIYATAKYSISPKALNNSSSTLHTLIIIFNGYQPLWRGATLIVDLYAELHNAATPWLFAAELGGDDRMRGYYRGRYVGNALLAVQAELRQHLWEGLSVVAWGGAGTIDSTARKILCCKQLPTYGGGIHWRHSSLSTTRIEIAFGRNSHYFILGYRTAF